MIPVGITPVTSMVLFVIPGAIATTFSTFSRFVFSGFLVPDLVTVQRILTLLVFDPILFSFSPEVPVIMGSV
jgi:hypothetical protein